MGQRHRIRFCSSSRSASASSHLREWLRSRVCNCVVASRQPALGLVSVLFTSRSDLQANLRDGSRAGETRGERFARNFLVAAEVAVAMVLLAGAGLLLRSFAHLLLVSPGFETEHLVKAEVSLLRY
jgi:hypothetical protein